ncbi:MAG TPA: VanZ family protein [Terriglobales bacterium]|nr:VanZ family protein [Terriglobales bacterium]
MKLLTRNFRYWLPVFFWLGVIAYESLRLSSSVTGGWLLQFLRAVHIQISWHAFAQLHHFLRKAGHVTGYGILCLLFFRAWFHTLEPSTFSSVNVASGKAANGRSQQLRGVHLRCASLAITITLVTAVLDEWHQAFDLARTSSPWDVALDVTGGITFLAFALFVLRLWRDLPKQWTPASA